MHGVVHDPEHRPVAGAKVTLQAADSEFVLHATTSADGEFELPQAPIGVYRMTVAAVGFGPVTQTLTVASGTNPVLHIPLAVGGATETVMVHGAASAADTATPTTLVTRQTIEETPGADRTIGTEMITDYVPAAYMTHDMLHMRGGHQTSWLIDGVAIPNTKIASNVGPQIDPKDIDSMETQRGSYDADLGDRTYGMFNVLPRNGFEFNRDGELVLYAGNLYDRRGTGRVWRPLGENRLVRKRDRLAVELRAGDAGGGDLPRCDKFGERVRVNDPQPDAQRSDPLRRAVAAGLFSSSLRPQPNRLRMSERQLRLLLLVGFARRTNGARLVCDCQLGTYHLAQGAGFRGAVLSLEPI